MQMDALPRENTSTIGSRTEGVVLAALLRTNRKVLLPFGGAARYDLGIDDDGKLIRVQCKTAVYKDGCVIFQASSLRRDRTKMGYHGDADLFGVYCPALDKVYLVPVEEVGSTDCRLRIESPKNGQTRGIRLAEQYEVKFTQSS